MVQTAPWSFVDHQNIYIPLHYQRPIATDKKLTSIMLGLTNSASMVFNPLFYPFSSYTKFYKALHLVFQKYCCHRASSSSAKFLSDPLHGCLPFWLFQHHCGL